VSFSIVTDNDIGVSSCSEQTW